MTLAITSPAFKQNAGAAIADPQLQGVLRQGLGYRQGDFPQAEAAARESLALPIYAELTEGQQRYVVHQIREFYGG